MGAAVDRLTALVDAPDRFTFSHDDLRDTQIAAMNEIFQDRRDRIKLLANRATEGNIAEVRSFDDMVPLLFPTPPTRATPRAS